MAQLYWDSYHGMWTNGKGAYWRDGNRAQSGGLPDSIWYAGQLRLVFATSQEAGMATGLPDNALVLIPTTGFDAGIQDVGVDIIAPEYEIRGSQQQASIPPSVLNEMSGIKAAASSGVSAGRPGTMVIDDVPAVAGNRLSLARFSGGVWNALKSVSLRSVAKVCVVGAIIGGTAIGLYGLFFRATYVQPPNNSTVNNIINCPPGATCYITTGGAGGGGGGAGTEGDFWGQIGNIAVIGIGATVAIGLVYVAYKAYQSRGRPIREVAAEATRTIVAVPVEAGRTVYGAVKGTKKVAAAA